MDDWVIFDGINVFLSPPCSQVFLSIIHVSESVLVVYTVGKSCQSKKHFIHQNSFRSPFRNCLWKEDNRGIGKVWPLKIKSDLCLCFVEIDIQCKRLELDNHWTGEFVWSSNKYMEDCNWVRLKICLICYAVETVSTIHA